MSSEILAGNTPSSANGNTVIVPIEDLEKVYINPELPNGVEHGDFLIPTLVERFSTLTSAYPHVAPFIDPTDPTAFYVIFGTRANINTYYDGVRLQKNPDNIPFLPIEIQKREVQTGAIIGQWVLRLEFTSHNSTDLSPGSGDDDEQAVALKVTVTDTDILFTCTVRQHTITNRFTALYCSHFRMTNTTFYPDNRPIISWGRDASQVGPNHNLEAYQGYDIQYGKLFTPTEGGLQAFEHRNDYVYYNKETGLFTLHYYAVEAVDTSIELNQPQHLTDWNVTTMMFDPLDKVGTPFTESHTNIPVEYAIGRGTNTVLLGEQTGKYFLAFSSGERPAIGSVDDGRVLIASVDVDILNVGEYNTQFTASGRNLIRSGTAGDAIDVNTTNADNLAWHHNIDFTEYLRSLYVTAINYYELP